MHNNVTFLYNQYTTSLNYTKLFIYFACGSAWVRSMDSDVKEGKQTEGALEKAAEKNMWTEER